MGHSKRDPRAGATLRGGPGIALAGKLEARLDRHAGSGLQPRHMQCQTSPAINCELPHNLHPNVLQVCGDSFNDNEAQVACRQLGYSSGRATTKGYFGGNSGIPIYLDEVDCYGGESSLNDCGFTRTHDCQHFVSWFFVHVFQAIESIARVPSAYVDTADVCSVSQAG